MSENKKINKQEAATLEEKQQKVLEVSLEEEWDQSL